MGRGENSWLMLCHNSMPTKCQNTDKYTKCSVGGNLKPFVGMLHISWWTAKFCENSIFVQAVGCLLFAFFENVQDLVKWATIDCYEQVKLTDIWIWHKKESRPAFSRLSYVVRECFILTELDFPSTNFYAVIEDLQFNTLAMEHQIVVVVVVGTDWHLVLEI